MTSSDTQRFDTIIIGGGQAGLAIGHLLGRQRRDFTILDAEARVGDAWRRRWDSLRLFTPARFSSLPGAPFLSNDGYFATKDEIADYLEGYAATFQLPVQLNTAVDALQAEHDGFTLTSGDRRFNARNVVVAVGPFQRPALPPFAEQIDAVITQMHSTAYRNPGHLPDGATLVVGAGNSGAEIAVELARAGRKVWLAGRDTGHLPQVARSGLAQRLFGAIFTTDTPLGRRFKQRASTFGAPLISLTRHEIAEAGVEFAPRIIGVRNGRPLLADERQIEPTTIIWATGFRPDFDWIDLPIFDERRSPAHTRGVAQTVPGLYFLGLFFQYRLASSTIGGVGADAAYIAEHLRKHRPSPASTAQPDITPAPSRAANA